MNKEKNESSTNLMSWTDISTVVKPPQLCSTDWAMKLCSNFFALPFSHKSFHLMNWLLRRELLSFLELLS